MRPFFSPAGRKALAALPPSKTLLAFDFDGTLAPIVANPQEAYTTESLLPLMDQLSQQTNVAVITGRALRDVRKRLHFKPDFLVGNHGMEGLKEFNAKAAQAKRVCRRWMTQLKRDLAGLPKKHGIVVEDKGHSLSLHYRHARNRSQAKAWLAQEIDNLWPEPRVIPGKMLFNVLPQGAPHKGLALKALMKRRGCSHAIFIGDDDTDEDAFGQPGPILSVRVGRKSSSQARFYIPGQKEMPALLHEISRAFCSL